MKLEKQVCSLELAKKLYKLVKQGSLFSWYDKHDSSGIIETTKVKTKYPVFGIYSAFTVAELGEMLPYVIEMEHRGGDAYLDIGKWEDRSGDVSWNICYRVGASKGDFKQEATTEADARAKMLIYLLENNLI